MINWTKIETEYITKNISQIALSKKYKISRSTIQDRCKKGNWTDKRRKYQAELAQKSVQKAVEKDAEFYAKLNEICNDASMALALRIKDMSENAQDMRSSDAANLTVALERIKGFLPEGRTSEDDAGGIIILPERSAGDE